MKFKRFQFFLMLFFTISCTIVDINESNTVINSNSSRLNGTNISGNISNNYTINSENFHKIDSNVEKKEIIKDSKHKTTFTIVNDNEKLKPKLGENEILEYESTSESQLKEGDNPVTILEVYLYNGEKEKIKSKYDFLTIEKENNNSAYKDHALKVVDGFMDTNADGIVSEEEKKFFKSKTPNINLIRRDENVYNLKGIINMSYGRVRHNEHFSYIYKNGRYLDKTSPTNIPYEIKEYFTNRLLDRNYVYNERLIIKSIGNGIDSDIKTKKFSNNILNVYQIMSPEMQALSRSESLLVKNSFRRDHDLIGDYYRDISTSYIDDKHNYYIDRLFREDYQTQSFLLRSFVVGEVGLLSEDGIKKGDERKYHPSFGSSYSAPFLPINTAAFPVETIIVISFSETLSIAIEEIPAW